MPGSEPKTTHPLQEPTVLRQISNALQKPTQSETIADVMHITFAGYPRLCTNIAANSAITIMAGDQRRLCIIMQNEKRITYAQL